MHETDSPASAATEDAQDESVSLALEPGAARIPVIEEVLVVGKRVVDRGGYRIVKQVTTTDEVVDEALRSETVHLERRPIGTLIEGNVPPLARQEGDEFVVPVVREVLVTEKRLLLVEEVRIRRTAAIHHEPQRVSLRQESILIERLESDSPD